MSVLVQGLCESCLNTAHCEEFIALLKQDEESNKSYKIKKVTVVVYCPAFVRKVN